MTGMNHGTEKTQDQTLECKEISNQTAKEVIQGLIIDEKQRLQDYIVRLHKAIGEIGSESPTGQAHQRKIQECTQSYDRLNQCLNFVSKLKID